MTAATDQTARADDPAKTRAKAAAARHGSAQAALRYWHNIGSRSGAWDREDYAYDMAIISLARAESERARLDTAVAA